MCTHSNAIAWKRTLSEHPKKSKYGIECLCRSLHEMCAITFHIWCVCVWYLTHLCKTNCIGWGDCVKTCTEPKLVIIYLPSETGARVTLLHTCLPASWLKEKKKKKKKFDDYTSYTIFRHETWYAKCLETVCGKKTVSVCAKMQFIEFLGKDEFFKSRYSTCIKDASCIKKRNSNHTKYLHYLLLLLLQFRQANAAEWYLYYIICIRTSVSCSRCLFVQNFVYKYVVII